MVTVPEPGASAEAAVESTVEPSATRVLERRLHAFSLIVLWRVGCRSIAIFAVLSFATVAFVTRRWTSVTAQAFAQRTARAILRIAGVTVVRHGQQPAEPGLVVCNHRSYIDILALLSAAPSSFLCKREVGRWPLIGTIAKRLGVVFVDRRSHESRRASLGRIASAVLAGRAVTAFPEGTTTRGPGMREPRPGLFRAAEAHGFAVVPAVIEYADPDDAWVDDDTLLRHCFFWLAKPRGWVALKFGSVLHPSAVDGDLQRRAEAWMRSALGELNSSFEDPRRARVSRE